MWQAGSGSISRAATFVGNLGVMRASIASSTSNVASTKYLLMKTEAQEGKSLRQQGMSGALFPTAKESHQSRLNLPTSISNIEP